MSEINVTKDNFTKEVLESDKTVLVDFWASWCGPCRMLAPVIAQIAEEHEEIKVCKINVDEEEELADKYNVMSIPSIMVFKNGEVTNKAVGFKPEEEILGMLQK